MTDKKIIKLIGGPLDGQTKEIEKGQTIYVFDEQFDIEDTEGDIPGGFLPPFYEITYEETPEGSGVFVLKE